jgi:hypothetical protein
MSALLSIIVTSLQPSTTEVHPPLSDPHVLHTPLELRNLYVREVCHRKLDNILLWG